VRAKEKQAARQAGEEAGDGASEEGDVAGMSAREEETFYEAIYNSAQARSAAPAFTELNLSRPLLRGVEAAGFVAPTPVQEGKFPAGPVGIFSFAYSLPLPRSLAV
jgi:hypothetical protein